MSRDGGVLVSPVEAGVRLSIVAIPDHLEDTTPSSQVTLTRMRALMLSWAIARRALRI